MDIPFAKPDKSKVWIPIEYMKVSHVTRVVFYDLKLILTLYYLFMRVTAGLVDKYSPDIS